MVVLAFGRQPRQAALVPGAPAACARLAQQRRARLPARLEAPHLRCRPAWAAVAAPVKQAAALQARANDDIKQDMVNYA